MSGSLLQLVAVGAQNSSLIGGANPVSFFNFSYNRHTNFSTDCVRQTIIGTPNFGNTVHITIDRVGDLLTNTMLKVTLPRLYCPKNPDDTKEIKQVYLNSIGNSMIENVTLKIGGQEIETFTGEWLEIWSELTLPKGKYEMYQQMVNKFSTTEQGKILQSLTFNHDNNTYYPYKQETKPLTLYIPLPFWFNKNPSLALPLIALQYHEVTIDITFRDLKDVILVKEDYSQKYLDINQKLVKMIDVELFADYIYLDNEERQSFAAEPKEYLIEQVQKNTCLFLQDCENVNVPLIFNHPVKELYWVFNKDNHRLFNSLDSPNPDKIAHKVFNDYSFSTADLIVNGLSRFGAHEEEYFSLVQPWKHHTSNYPGIYSFSFALAPEKYLPTGSFNFSRLSSAKLHLKLNPNKNKENGVVNVYALNNNILKIISGMGGLAFSD